MPTACFMLEPTGRVRWGLRRYSASGTPSPCPLDTARGADWGYHNATVHLGEEPEQRTERGHVSSGDEPPHDDPRWPTHCRCGYEFAADDHWQRVVDVLYRRADTGEECTLRDAPPGAMWDATWMPREAADGRSLVVKLPNGMDWWIDGPSSQGGRWTREGEPPHITARPSIWAGQGRPNEYHGFLTAGVFSDPL